MALKAVHDTQEEIPEQYRDLYSERDDKWELTGISGIKTQADIGRLQINIDKERDAHKATKEELKSWSALGKLEEIQGQIDKYPELEAASKGKLDESELQAAVDRRVEATIKTRLSPVERENNKLKAKIEEGSTELTTLRAEARKRTIFDDVDKAIGDLKVPDDYRDDVRMWAERVLDVTEDGVRTKDNVGVPPGMDSKSWLEEMIPKRPAWAPGSRGANTRGSGSIGGFTGENPWSAEGWNVTKQGALLRTKGAETAEKMAKQAGSFVGATSAPKKK